MGSFGLHGDPGSEARDRMEQAEKRLMNDEAGERKRSSVPGYRFRGRLYDRINVPLKTMDIIIGVIVALIVAAIIVGVALPK